MSFSIWWNAVHALKNGELASKAVKLKNAADHAKTAIAYGDFSEKKEFLQRLKKVVWFTATIANIRNRDKVDKK